MRSQNARLATVIRQGASAGVVRADLDPDDLATTLWATLNGLLSQAWRPGGQHADPQPSTEILPPISPR